MSRLALGAMLLVVWVLLWGSASPANVLSGLAVVALLFVVVPSSRKMMPSHLAHPWGLVKLGGWFVVNIVTSNVVLSWAILSPRAHLRTGVVRVPMTTPDVGIATMVTNITALTPGSMVVQVDHDPPVAVLWVHVLTPGAPEAVARRVSALERYCIEAVGTADQIAAMRAAADPELLPAPDPSADGGTS
ncbi:MAG: Na+/H+ antiporter subunit E [Actinomycetota bacterium]|nr:Na+/H+ antiporter subunit E [Actinomycetota bacterium]